MRSRRFFALDWQFRSKFAVPRRFPARERGGINFTVDPSRGSSILLIAGSARGTKRVSRSSENYFPRGDRVSDRLVRTVRENSIRITAGGCNIGHPSRPQPSLPRGIPARRVPSIPFFRRSPLCPIFVRLSSSVRLPLPLSSSPSFSFYSSGLSVQRSPGYYYQEWREAQSKWKTTRLQA